MTCVNSGKESSITMTSKGVRKMKNKLLKMIRYFCLLSVIIFSLIAIIGSGGGGGDGENGKEVL